ncbi:hypothetical protein HAX54_053300, partial [Datura stramonium]|nr:hypothetical protein [Datura stramonium]
NTGQITIILTLRDFIILNSILGDFELGLGQYLKAHQKNIRGTVEIKSRNNGGGPRKLSSSAIATDLNLRHLLQYFFDEGEKDAMLEELSKIESHVVSY